MKNCLKFLLVLSLYTLYFILYTAAVNAQQISLSLTPNLSELAIKPGQSASQKYFLKNSGDPALVKIMILPIEPRDNEGHLTIKNQLESPIRFELVSQTIKLDEAFFSKNDEAQKFELAIRIPEGAPLKDYYFTLLAETQAPPAQEGVVSVRAKIRVGSPLLLTVTSNGQVEIKPKISIFAVKPRLKLIILGRQLNLFDSWDKIPVALLLDNKGKNLIKPRGKISLKGPLGYSKDFEIKEQNVLAESQRLLKSEYSPSNIQYPTSNSLALSGFFLGNYNLSASISFGDGTPTLFASTSLLALPLKFLVLFGIIIILILIIIAKLKSL